MICLKCRSNILKLKHLGCEMYICPCCGEIGRDQVSGGEEPVSKPEN